ncbi:MAG TPA: flagellar export protein FliJ [Syntrophorhabdus sp.]|jgi:flagellar export protein FliJ|nr:flagellar export protein FliJ [Syntrophorhabdus sp.]OQB78014.1 MAG: Flagellar FliJ protein [Deltaproteobacteria bacterium ADurb.Bin135]NMC93615.1 flagellar export protein FliJ [Syntrophorhabdus sp.]HNY69602.1 flagellar export protein FliJ [Syntrophorhabdus sp.]HOH25604.1 flagellar export protein FliJ [Syntrophorhabdus sp.]
MTKFRLSRIIDVKEKLIEDKERELEEAINTIDDITMALDATEKDVEKTYNELAIPSLSGGDFSVLKDYLSYLNDRKQRLIDEKDLTQQRIEQLRINLINLMKELKMLEILRSKAAKVVKRTENRRIQKNLDSMALRIGERRI